MKAWCLSAELKVYIIFLIRRYKFIKKIAMIWWVFCRADLDGYLFEDQDYEKIAH